MSGQILQIGPEVRSGGAKGETLPYERDIAQNTVSHIRMNRKVKIEIVPLRRGNNTGESRQVTVWPHLVGDSNRHQRNLWMLKQEILCIPVFEQAMIGNVGIVTRNILIRVMGKECKWVLKMG
jgi:hypothetical protein